MVLMSRSAFFAFAVRTWVPVLILAGCSSSKDGGVASQGANTSSGGSSGGSPSTSGGGPSTGGGDGPSTSGGSASGTNGGAASGGGTGTSGALYGDPHSGTYNLGVVDFEETQWHNACAPYPQEIRDLTGNYLAGVSNGFGGDGSLCDACILITAKGGKSLIARIITYGVTNGPNDIDVSQPVFDALASSDNTERSMSWQLAECPDTGTLRYQFQTQANPWWTSFWVRNPRVPVTKVEVKSANHADFFTLQRGTDGTLNDAQGFGQGAFTLRISGTDGSSVTDSFDSFSMGQLIVSQQQLQ
jgi:hypothetical protein